VKRRSTVTIRPESERRPESEQEAVVAAIKANEEPIEGGEYACSNDTIVEVTGLDRGRVADIVGQLWKEGRIEGLLSLGETQPFLSGIRRVMPGRQRHWGAEGHYKSQP
jgi:hypothetical protein